MLHHFIGLIILTGSLLLKVRINSATIYYDRLLVSFLSPPWFKTVIRVLKKFLAEKLLGFGETGTLFLIDSTRITNDVHFVK